MLLPAPKLYGTLSPTWTPAQRDTAPGASAAAARPPRSSAATAGAPAKVICANSRLVIDMPLVSS
jgi:hypothetical protein